MTPERWHRVTEIFHAALARESQARGAFIAFSCGDDADLRRDVESMIDAHRQAAGFGEARSVVPAAVLEPGSSFGPYRIERSLGAGGMGEVYKARDTRLGRTVALKVLAPELAVDPEFRSRFEREARAISQLDHPHICALYDVGNQDGTAYLVMQYLDGETLAQRLERGAMPIAAALTVAVEVADALDGAHTNGVIHRDLKPANIFLTKSGVKLLDFGLAKTKTAVLGSSIETAGPQSAITTPGMVLGTVPYMAPEQLEGREADARTDLFAFGAVVFEMIAGRMAFSGEHQANVMSAILTIDPPRLSSLRADVPAGLDRVVATCLAKDPEARWQTARDAKRALSWIAEPAIAASTRGETRNRRAVALAGAALLIVAVVLAVVAWTVAGSATRDLASADRAVRFELFPPEGMAFGLSPAFMAVSPDGRSLAFHGANASGEWILWIRSLDSLGTRVVHRANSGMPPFWSPDSRSVAFVAGGKLRTVDVTSGLTRTLTDAAAHNGAWSRDGVILFKQHDGGLSRSSADGAQPASVTTLDVSRGEVAHFWPQFLPDGRRFLYSAKSTQPEHDGVVYAASLDGRDRVAVLSADSHAVYVPQGYLIFVRGNTLFAQSFDAERLRLQGEPIPIAEHVEINTETHRGAFSVSQTGVLAYRPVSETQLVWLDRSGKPLESVGPRGRYRNPALSPDGQRVAVARMDLDTGAPDIWVIDLNRGAASQLTAQPLVDDMPVWSPDGNHIIFKSSRSGRWGLHRKAASGVGGEEVIVTDLDNRANPLEWSRDGRFLLYDFRDDVWRLSLFGGRTATRVLGKPTRETQAQLSPDGRWIAFVSGETGRFEVMVAAFPSGESQRQVSTNGGIGPKWRDDGKELYFVAADQSLMAASITLGSTIETGVPEKLFATRMRGSPVSGYIRNEYAPAADGQRFLIDHHPGAPPSSSATVVTNWMAALRK